MEKEVKYIYIRIKSFGNWVQIPTQACIRYRSLTSNSNIRSRIDFNVAECNIPIYVVVIYNNNNFNINQCRTFVSFQNAEKYIKKNNFKSKPFIIKLFTKE